MDDQGKQRLEDLATRVASLEVRLEQAAQPAPRLAPGQTLGVTVGHLVQAQTDLQAVTDLLDRVLATEVQADPVARKAQIRAILNPAAAFVAKQQEQIGHCVQAVYELQVRPELADYRGELARIANHWERAEPASLAAVVQAATTDDPAVTVDLARVRELADQYKRLRREIGLFTIPLRIRGITRQGFGVGAPLDFHERFAGELPDPLDRVAVLRQLAELRVDAVGGMVDVEDGMIFRVGGRARRWVSYLLIVGAAALGLGVVYVLSGDAGALEDLNLDFDGPGNENLGFDDLWVPYLLMMAGVLGHIVKKASELSVVERSRGGEGGPEVVLDRLPLWVHVREYRFLLTVIAAVVVFVLLGVSGQLTGSTALFAGYTVDSVSDLAFQRFIGAVSAQAADVKKLLSAGTT